RSSTRTAPSPSCAPRTRRTPRARHDGTPRQVGAPMTNVDLLTDAHLTNARSAPNGRSAEVVLHDGPLRQTILALRAGVEVGEHNSPPAASIQVLRGRVRVTALGERSEERRVGKEGSGLRE